MALCPQSPRTRMWGWVFSYMSLLASLRTQDSHSVILSVCQPFQHVSCISNCCVSIMWLLPKNLSMCLSTLSLSCLPPLHPRPFPHFLWEVRRVPQERNHPPQVVPSGPLGHGQQIMATVTTQVTCVYGHHVPNVFIKPRLWYFKMISILFPICRLSPLKQSLFRCFRGGIR